LHRLERNSVILAVMPDIHNDVLEFKTATVWLKVLPRY
jgi:hypothetical protein